MVDTAQTAPVSGCPLPRSGGAVAPKPHGLPVIDLDPFSDDLLREPYPFYDALRAAGPVVWLSRWNICAVARHAEMHTVLNNPDIFISGRGVGVCDYGRVAPPRPPILILESDAPLHSRLRGQPHLSGPV